MSATEKREQQRNQKDRHEYASLLAKQAVPLLERTRLNVRITCQAYASPRSLYNAV